MPEAQKEQIQDDKLVPIDTSGESVDVELKESKVTPVEEEQEVVEEQQAAPEPEKTEEEKPSTDKGEHDEYSEKVNKRIAKLVGKLREAERREDAAVKYAEGLKNKQTDLETQLQSLNQNYATTMETASTSQVEEAKLSENLLTNHPNIVELYNEPSFDELKGHLQNFLNPSATEETKSEPEMVATEGSSNVEDDFDKLFNS